MTFGCYVVQVLLDRQRLAAEESPRIRRPRGAIAQADDSPLSSRTRSKIHWRLSTMPLFSPTLP